MQISKENLTFLKSLTQNNNRDWFEDNKTSYQSHMDEFKSFHAVVKSRIDQHDHIGRDRVYRIYRDIRFSKDKTPYKTHWSGGFQRATTLLRGGYYYQIGPLVSQVAGGFFGPNSQDLLHIRKQISQDPEPLQEVLESQSFKTHFGVLRGTKLKTAPKGFDQSDPAIELLRHKQFLVYKQFTDDEVLQANLAEKIDDTFKAMRPFFDVMSMYLTTDLNGESLV